MDEQAPRRRGAPRKHHKMLVDQKTITLPQWIWDVIDKEIGNTPSQKILRLVQRKYNER